MILETKKLNGDIYINESGDFIRSIKNKYGKVIKKEGIYSPISQNDRHIRIVKNMLIKEGIIRTFPIISGVVIANPKSIVNKSRASKKIKDEIFRYDQLTEVIRSKIKYYSKDRNILESIMKNIAEFFIINNKAIKYDYMNKYSLIEEDFMKTNVSTEEVETVTEEVDEVITDKLIEEVAADAVDNEEVKDKSYEYLYDKLKEYRLNKSREEKIKPYFIYNNEMLEEIIKLRPTNKEELIKIKGFGPVKIEKYGEDIVNIIKG